MNVRDAAPASASRQALHRMAAETAARISDPRASAWVSANAGSGKTYVLVQRVLRLLLAGVPAASILCLTFTKAAAAEMLDRLASASRQFAMLGDTELDARLAVLIGHAPTAHERARARSLFPHLVDMAGTLRIVTIHAFCETVLRRFPIEADIPPRPTILTEVEAEVLRRAATDTVLTHAAAAPASRVGNALAEIVARVDDAGFAELIDDIVSDASGMRDSLRETGDDDDRFDTIASEMANALGVPRSASRQELIAALCTACPPELAARAARVFLGTGKPGDAPHGAAFDALARARGEDATVAALAAAFCTKEGEAYSPKRFTKAVRAADPTLADAIGAAEAHYMHARAQLAACDTIAASMALIVLGDAIRQDYAERKRAGGKLDFDDLIIKTAELLGRTGAADWVRHRLDTTLDHLLIDEAQDTSPAQWAIVNALTEVFFDERGDRTVLGVGDEKQSIFSFHGAAPEQFRRVGETTAQRARLAGATWHVAPLTISFRSAAPILQAVDGLFGEAGAALGLAPARIEHHTMRDGAAGLVELWETEHVPSEPAGVAWLPNDEPDRVPAAEARLAARIAATIRTWLDTGEQLEARGRAITPGDVLILVRWRAPLAELLTAALKTAGVPVAGADRIALNDSLAVLDLLALAEASLMPDDDLTLACVLKGPAFALTDDDLFAIGHGRPGQLYDALAARAEHDATLRDIVGRLARFGAHARAALPYDFLKARLDEDGVRCALLARLGAECLDAVEELLTAALAYQTHGTSLTAFCAFLRASNFESKRQSEAAGDAVRIMTVHGAKGLEAPIVFLPDTCSEPCARTRPLVTLRADDPAIPPLVVWPTRDAKKLCPAIIAACEARRIAEEQEHLRLLYVAMTRAADRLYIGGYHGAKAPKAMCWHSRLMHTLAPSMARDTDAAGRPVWRLAAPQSGPVPAAREQAAPVAADPPLPDWAITSAADETAGVSLRASDAARTDEAAAAGGRAAHVLLDDLAALPDAAREAAIAALPPVSQAVAAPLLALLRRPALARLFGAASRGEVALAVPLAGAVARGIVDRVVVDAEGVWLADFKFGDDAPHSLSAVHPGTLRQLAIYRAALLAIYPGRPLRVSLVMLSGAVIDVPAAALDRAESALPGDSSG